VRYLASERDKDDELTSKNRKLNKKIDKYKSELDDAKQDVTTLKSELEQARQDKVIIGLHYYYCYCCV